MIFPGTSASSSGSPLPGALIDLYLDENNNSNLNNSSHSSIMAALMAVAATTPSISIVSNDHPNNQLSSTNVASDVSSMMSSSPLTRPPLTAMALKHVLYANKSASMINNNSNGHQLHHHHLHHRHSNSASGTSNESSSCSSSPSSSPVLSSNCATNYHQQQLSSYTTLPLSTAVTKNGSNCQMKQFSCSSISPTIKRPCPGLSELRSVKRALFVDKSEIDHDANLALVKEQLRTQQQLASKRWNFDFEAGRPSVLSSFNSSLNQNQNSEEKQDRYQWTPHMSTASTTCPATMPNKQQPDSGNKNNSNVVPIKRKLSISDYFATTKKMKIVCKQSDKKLTSQSASVDTISCSPVDTKSVSSTIGTKMTTLKSKSSQNSALDVQLICCLSPSKTKSNKSAANHCTLTKGSMVRSHLTRRSKRLNTHSTTQCKKQLKL